VDEAVNKLQSMIRKAKDKMVDRQRGEADAIDELMNGKSR
jgi:ribosome-associated translation inhibitor RaiA